MLIASIGPLIVAFLGLARAQELPPFCSTPPDRRPCTPHGVMRYYFDPKTLNCDTFIDRNCPNQGNNFVSENECLAACVGQLLKDETFIEEEFEPSEVGDIQTGNLLHDQYIPELSISSEFDPHSQTFLDMESTSDNFDSSMNILSEPVLDHDVDDFDTQAADGHRMVLVPRPDDASLVGEGIQDRIESVSNKDDIVTKLIMQENQMEDVNINQDERDIIPAETIQEAQEQALAPKDVIELEQSINIIQENGNLVDEDSVKSKKNEGITNQPSNVIEEDENIKDKTQDDESVNDDTALPEEFQHFEQGDGFLPDDYDFTQLGGVELQELSNEYIEKTKERAREELDDLELEAAQSYQEAISHSEPQELPTPTLVPVTTADETTTALDLTTVPTTTGFVDVTENEKHIEPLKPSHFINAQVGLSYMTTSETPELPKQETTSPTPVFTDTVKENVHVIESVSGKGLPMSHKEKHDHSIIMDQNERPDNNPNPVALADETTDISNHPEAYAKFQQFRSEKHVSFNKNKNVHTEQHVSFNSDNDKNTVRVHRFTTINKANNPPVDSFNTPVRPIEEQQPPTVLFEKPFIPQIPPFHQMILQIRRKPMMSEIFGPLPPAPPQKTMIPDIPQFPQVPRIPELPVQSIPMFQLPPPPSVIPSSPFIMRPPPPPLSLMESLPPFIRSPFPQPLPQEPIEQMSSHLTDPQVQSTDPSLTQSQPRVLMNFPDQEDNQEHCLLAPDPGPCKAMFSRWYFNSKQGRCMLLIYGGCQGNENNFLTQEECEKTCNEHEATGSENKPTTEAEIVQDDLLDDEMKPVSNIWPGLLKMYSKMLVSALSQFSNSLPMEMAPMAQQEDNKPGIDTNRIPQDNERGDSDETGAGQLASNVEDTEVPENSNEIRIPTAYTRNPVEIDTDKLEKEIEDARENLKRKEDKGDTESEKKIYWKKRDRDYKKRNMKQWEQRKPKGMKLVQVFVQRHEPRRPPFAPSYDRHPFFHSLLHQPGLPNMYPGRAMTHDDTIPDRHLFSIWRQQQLQKALRQAYEQKAHPQGEANLACLEPVDSAFCPIGEPKLKWFYNQKSGKCEMFFFGGCGKGNFNRFESEEECEGTCLVTSPQPEEYTTETNTDISTEEVTSSEIEKEITTESPALPVKQDILESRFEEIRAHAASSVDIDARRMQMDYGLEYGSVIAILTLGAVALLVLIVFGSAYIYRKWKGSDPPKREKIVEAVLKSHLNGGFNALPYKMPPPPTKVHPTPPPPIIRDDTEKPLYAEKLIN